MLQKYTHKYLFHGGDYCLIVSDISSCAGVREGDSEIYLLYAGTMCVCVWFIRETVLPDAAVGWLAFLLVFGKPCVQIPARNHLTYLIISLVFSKSV